MYCYTAFNLRITSEIELPILSPTSRGGDITITFEETHGRVEPTPGMDMSFHITPRLATLAFAGLGTITVRQGTSISIALTRNADISLLPTHLTNTALAVLLYQRGLLVLQASAISIDGIATIYIDKSGGESPLVGALHSYGHRILARAITAIDTSGQRARVIPTFPRQEAYHNAVMKPSSVGPLGALPARISMRLQHPKHSLASPPVDLDVIYLLSDDVKHTIEPMPFQSALSTLIHHSYPACILQPGGRAYLQQCAHLAANQPVYRFIYPDHTATLSSIVNAIEIHAMAHRLIASRR